MFPYIYLGVPMFLLQWSIPTFLLHPVWGKEIFTISVSLPTDDSSCSLPTACCLPSKAPGRAGGGRCPQLQAPQHQQAQRELARVRAVGFQLLSERFETKCEGGQKKLTKKVKAETKQAAFGHCLVDFSYACLDTHCQYWLRAVECFFFPLDYCTTTTNKA